MANLLTAPLPGNDYIGEAWLLSDLLEVIIRAMLPMGMLLKENDSRTIGFINVGACWENWPGRFARFPLLKFLDVRDTLSVQVHPSDRQTQYIPVGEGGKTGAWVVLETGAKSASTPVSSLRPRLTFCSKLT